MLSLNGVPRFRESVLLESTPDQSYLYDSESHSYALLDNEIALEIVRLCDGTQNISSICEQIALRYEAPPERIQEDVLATLAMLVQESFLHISDSNA